MSFIIIAVNDASTDLTLHILEKMSKNDSRIKIINNDRNHGLLYSRSMGILNCSGEFVMNLDPDDKLEGNDNLETLYKYSIQYNLDFLRFLHKRIPRNKLDINFCQKMDKYQFKIPDCYITNKFIKKNVIIKAYNNFKKKIYSFKWNYHEDNIWNLLIRKYANSFENIHKIIYIIIRNKKSLMANTKNMIEFKNRIYKFETISELNLVNIKNEKKFFKKIVKDYSYFKEKEIRKRIIHLYYKLMKKGIFS
jgi:glycosyltransferase involved in cell wall biosynthesis